MAGPGEVRSFHWADYLVFVLFLVISAGVGIVQGYWSRRNQTTKDFLTGGGKMHYFPVALSMMASFLSAIFVLGTPAEMYAYGTMYSYLGVAYFIGYPIASYVYLPIFHRLKLTSGYECGHNPDLMIHSIKREQEALEIAKYLELRFSRGVRVAGSITFAVMMLLYMSVVLYAPALALNQVTQISLTGCILGVGAVCTFYTALGGMRATVWNDAFQMFITFAGTILLIILGAIEVGGGEKAFSIASQGGRIIYDDFNPDPFMRHSFWTQLVGGTTFNILLYAAGQTNIQKFLSVDTVENGQKAVWAATVTTFSFMVLNVILGLIMYAYWVDCDPLTSGVVEKTDQLVPLFVMEVMGHLHGLPGLFLATVFGAALSSVSGGLNALAAVFLDDLIRPIYKQRTGKTMTERLGTIITRCLATGCGLITIAMGFLAQVFGSTVLQIALSIFGMVGGPLAGLMTNGMLLPWVNTAGAVAGLVISLVVTLWVSLAGIVLGDAPTLLNMTTEACEYNFTLAPPADDGDDILVIYKLSYMYYGTLAIIISVLVALPVSFITGHQKPSELRPGLVFSCGKNCCCCCSPRCAEASNCGVPQSEDQEEDYDGASDKKDLDLDHVQLSRYRGEPVISHSNGISNLRYSRNPDETLPWSELTKPSSAEGTASPAAGADILY